MSSSAGSIAGGKVSSRHCAAGGSCEGCALSGLLACSLERLGRCLGRCLSRGVRSRGWWLWLNWLWLGLGRSGGVSLLRVFFFLFLLLLRLVTRPPPSAPCARPYCPRMCRLTACQCGSPKTACESGVVAMRYARRRGSPFARRRGRGREGARDAPLSRAVGLSCLKP
jgi:hypothetical protein